MYTVKYKIINRYLPISERPRLWHCAHKFFGRGLKAVFILSQYYELKNPNVALIVKKNESLTLFFFF